MFITPPCPPPPAKPVTIWVHGTRLSSILPFLGINKTIKKAADAAIAAPSGLVPLTHIDKKRKSYKLLKALSDSNPKQFPEDTFYSFGWSGDLDLQARKKAAQDLLQAIIRLSEEYKSMYGVSPPITFITHSHGGNVLLLMANYIQEPLPFHIERTILLATPVQKETAHLVVNPIFGTIYSLHSHLDMVQILDPQRLHLYKHAFAAWQETKSMYLFKEAFLKGKTHPFFSERHFPHAPHIIQADICWQSGTQKPKEFGDNSHKVEFFFNSLATKIKNHKRGVLHTEFITPAFMQHVPFIITQLDAHILEKRSSDHDIEIMI